MVKEDLIDSKLKSVETIEEMAAKLRAWDKKVVFTNGCFDIIHSGHVKYLFEAKSLGDILIIGLNSDNSVKRLKGNSRPINRQDDRAYVLSALIMVDYIVIFEEDTPYDLIKRINPDFLVKGGDWPVKDIVGSDIVLASGGTVKSLPYHAGHSTTGIIEKTEGEVRKK
jgi:D-beta-D-heptose 7-phosphate kinase/D-beta-D-heptose 1-phosphate adenosyltransferase